MPLSLSIEWAFAREVKSPKPRKTKFHQLMSPTNDGKSLRNKTPSFGTLTPIVHRKQPSLNKSYDDVRN